MPGITAAQKRMFVSELVTRVFSPRLQELTNKQATLPEWAIRLQCECRMAFKKLQNPEYGDLHGVKVTGVSVVDLLSRNQAQPGYGVFRYAVTDILKQNASRYSAWINHDLSLIPHFPNQDGYLENWALDEEHEKQHFYVPIGLITNSYFRGAVNLDYPFVIKKTQDEATGEVTRTPVPTKSAKALFSAVAIKRMQKFVDRELEIFDEIDGVFNEAGEFALTLYKSLENVRSYKKFLETWPTLEDEWKSIMQDTDSAGTSLVTTRDINRVYTALNHYNLAKAA